MKKESQRRTKHTRQAALSGQPAGMQIVAAPFGARFLTPNGAATAAARAEQSRKRQCVGRMLKFQKFRACGAKIPETPTCTHALRLPQPFSPTMKKEMEKYLCKVCGKKHDVFRGIRSPLPKILDEIPDEEKDARIKNLGNVFIIDEETILGLGYIFIEMENLDESIFYWEVWVEISRKSLADKVEEFKTKSIVELEASLIIELPFYEKSTGLKCKVLIPTSDNEDMEIKIEENSLLKKDQSKPITEERMIEIMQMLHHHPEREERQNFYKSFKQRLSEELENAESKYIANEKDFVIDLSVATVLFQIISNKMLETKRYNERGFGLHLSFEESQEEIAKFRSKEYSKDFDYHYLDEIPTYQIDLGKAKIRLKN